MMETTQEEPSSPKVTCIGQVRARRSATASASGSGCGTSNCRPRLRLRKQLFSSKFNFRFIRINGAFRKLVIRWGLFFRPGYCTEVDAREESLNKNDIKRHEENNGGENLGDMAQESEMGIISSPPRNALTLTRCRSAPHRCSSLAGRIWVSPSESSGAAWSKSGNQMESEQEFQAPRCGNWGRNQESARNTAKN